MDIHQADKHQQIIICSSSPTQWSITVLAATITELIQVRPPSHLTQYIIIFLTGQ